MKTDMKQALNKPWHNMTALKPFRRIKEKSTMHLLGFFMKPTFRKYFFLKVTIFFLTKDTVKNEKVP